MAGQWTLLRRSALLLEHGAGASASLTLGVRRFGAPSVPKAQRARSQFKGSNRQPQKSTEPPKPKPEAKQQQQQRHNKRRGRKAVDQETPVFTNKFQNLLSFAFDASNEPPMPPTPSKQPETSPELSSLDLLDGINKQDDGPELTLAQLGLAGFDDDDDASFAKRQPRHPRQKPKKTKLFSGDKDPSTVLAALGIPSDGEGDRNDGPPISRKSIKMNTKRKKGTRNLLKNFQFENSIFDSDADLFGDIDWEERSDPEDRERRRSQRLQRKDAKRKPKEELPPQEVEIPTSLTVKELAASMGHHFTTLKRLCSSTSMNST